MAPAPSFWAQNLWLPTLAVILIIAGYFYYESKKKYWATKFNVTGVIPFPLIGEFYTMLIVDKLKLEKDRLKMHGKIYGTYMGGKPRLLIADPEVMRQICIKDFDMFPNHNVNVWANKFQKQFLIWLKDDHWRRVRGLMTPTFTSGKMKRMFKFLDGCAEDLVALFEGHLTSGGKSGGNKSVINLKDAFSMYTMDSIATCCFGLKLKRKQTVERSRNLQQKQQASATRDDFLEMAKKVASLSYMRLAALFLIPTYLLKLIGFEMSPESNFEPFVQRLEKLIEKRQQEPNKYDDLLQSLVDAKGGDQLELNELDQRENHHACLTQESLIDDHDRMLRQQDNKTKAKPVQMSQLEIISESMLMIIAGYETTSTLLSNCCYSLAFHPKIQERLYDELSKLAKQSDDGANMFEYDSLTSCNYLDSVVSETLRTLPSVTHTDRVAKQDYFIEKYQVPIAKGSALLLGLYAVQNDSDNWYKPEKFDPDRFMPGNREKIIPGSYAPFSMGPRHCIGMRFALMEAKLSLAKLMMKFRFQPAPGTKYPPRAIVRPGFVVLKNPIVKAVKR